MIAKIEVVDHHDYTHQLHWVLDDGDQGGAIGEVAPSARARKGPESAEDRELRVVFEAAKPFADEYRAHHGFVFHTASKAQTALRAVRAALRADLAEQQNKPWPEWAKQAASAGWKAPRGWKP